MKPTFLLFACMFFLMTGHAQGPGGTGVWDGQPLDSAVVSFDDSLLSHSSAVIHYSLDTAHASLWRIGSTGKAFFASGRNGRVGIMTDTAAPYPVRANDWFLIKLSTSFLNPIISFTHKYETSQGYDGGVVEYSFDSSTWSNAVGGCFINTRTDSFYHQEDTVTGGMPAFTGTSSWKRSRLQLFQGIPLKDASACSIKWPIYIRFRFISDSTTDTLAGWIIRNITIERDLYSGDVPAVNGHPSLSVHPNPSSDGYFYWPELKSENAYSIMITDVTGRPAFNSPYVRRTDVRHLSPGLYFYRVRNGSLQFTGTLIRQ